MGGKRGKTDQAEGTREKQKDTGFDEIDRDLLVRFEELHEHRRQLVSRLYDYTSDTQCNIRLEGNFQVQRNMFYYPSSLQ
jgi:hypothetical protein